MGLFLGLSALGLSGMAPTVSFGDSGEFIASAATLSIPHAPGYPLFCLLGRGLGALLPWANWGYRVNLVSVLCAASAAAVLADAAWLAGAAPAAAGLGALLVALSPLWLHTSLQAEVFALNTLLAACALWIVCRFRARAISPRPMAALGLVVGLGGANHHMLIFALPALLWETWARSAAPQQSVEAALPRHKARSDRALGRFLKGWAWFLGFGLLGLATYLYLPLRARAFPPLDWGHPAKLDSFLHVLLRRDYGSFSLTVEGAASGRLGSLWPQLLRYLEASYSDLGAGALGLAGLGFAACLAGRSLVTWRLPLAWALVCGPGFLWLGNPPFDAQTSYALERFYLMSWLGLGLLAALGATELGRAWAWAPRLLWAVPIVAAGFTFPSWAQRRDLAAYDYGRNLLRSLEPNSLLYIDGGDDTFYTTAYLQYAEGLRPDVEPHDRGGLVFRNPYGPDFRSLTKERKEERRLQVEAAAISARPVFYSTLRERVLPEFEHEPRGLLRRVLPPKAPAEPLKGGALWAAYPIRFSLELARDHYRYRALVPVYDLMRAAEALASGRHDESLARLRRALSLGPDVTWLPSAAALRAQWVGYDLARREQWARAEQAYRFALRLEPQDENTWINLGVTLERQERWAAAEEAYRRVLERARDTAYQNLGTLYWKQARWREAAEMFEEAAKLRPADAGLRGFAESARRRAGAAP